MLEVFCHIFMASSLPAHREPSYMFVINNYLPSVPYFDPWKLS